MLDFFKFADGGVVPDDDESMEPGGVADVTKLLRSIARGNTMADAMRAEEKSEGESEPDNITQFMKLRGFADGGSVDDPLAAKVKNASNPIVDILGILTGDSADKFGDVTGKISRMGEDKLDEATTLMSDKFDTVMKLVDFMGFEDGGNVPDFIKDRQQNGFFAQTRNRREQEAGLNDNGSGGGVTINVNTGDAKQQPKQETNPTTNLLQKLREIAGFSHGGQVPGPGDSMEAEKLLRALRHYANGGAIRTGQSDARAGGEIRGPESKTGEDNQVIAVAGGEGILPKDVMEVPGVPELVKSLIQKYHQPVN